MPQIDPDNRYVLEELFAPCKLLRVIIDAVLEQGYGTAVADSEQKPEVGLLTLDVHAVLGGRPDHPFARELIQGLSPVLIVPGSDAWRRAVIQAHKARIQIQPRVGFSLEKLDIDHLRALAQRLPPGYQLRRIDLQLAPQAMGPIAYTSAEEFVERGVGFCTLFNGEVVAKARSYINSSKAIEISIMTAPEHQGKGLATATGAALVAHCLEHRIEPYWSASNPISVRVAEKLGYVQSGSYELLEFH